MTMSEDILKRWAKTFNDYRTEARFYTKPMKMGDSSSSPELLIGTMLMN
jgi:hypothetical protein